MAPKVKSSNSTGLGRAIINQKAKDIRSFRETGLYTTDMDASSRLKSVTQERDLDEFLSTARLARTDFSAERRNVKIVHSGPTVMHNAHLLSEQEERDTLQKHQQNRKRLVVPRRPSWSKSMTSAQLERQENDAFLQWRRGLAVLEDNDGFILTPFERNLEVWRQLWRVLERSHLVVQIIDARNPLRFRCEDLEDYVRGMEISEDGSRSTKDSRKCLLLINKADLLSERQRIHWADYFEGQGVAYAFFSAANAMAAQGIDQVSGVTSETTGLDESKILPEHNCANMEFDETATHSSSEESEHRFEDSEKESFTDEDVSDHDDPRVKVLSALELEDLFVHSAPDLSLFSTLTGGTPTRLVVGLVGYPNVGKSSTINSLIGAKRVSVSSTPGKTKHFQTIVMSDSITLCDCPGLVFPQFTTTRAELVCDGVLPIDQLREYMGPTALVVKRIPKEVLELTYGLSLHAKNMDEGGSGHINVETLLVAYAISRGFTRSGQGNPDEARAARYILKDYVNAKLLYCHPPPDIDPEAFNQETHSHALRIFSQKKRAPRTRVRQNASTYVASSPPFVPSQQEPRLEGVDRAFFRYGTTQSRQTIKGGGGSSRSSSFPHQYSVANDGTLLASKMAKASVVLANAEEAYPGKKRHKKEKRIKQRNGKGCD